MKQDRIKNAIIREKIRVVLTVDGSRISALGGLGMYGEVILKHQ